MWSICMPGIVTVRSVGKKPEWGWFLKGVGRIIKHSAYMLFASHLTHMHRNLVQTTWSILTQTNAIGMVKNEWAEVPCVATPATLLYDVMLKKTILTWQHRLIDGLHVRQQICKIWELQVWLKGQKRYGQRLLHWWWPGDTRACPRATPASYSCRAVQNASVERRVTHFPFQSKSPVRTCSVDENTVSAMWLKLWFWTTQARWPTMATILPKLIREKSAWYFAYAYLFSFGKT